MKRDGFVEQHFRDPEVLLAFMRRTRKPVFHKSNLFLRDIQHAIRDYFESVERKPLTFRETERMAAEVVHHYVMTGLFRAVGNQAYVLNMRAFTTPSAGTYEMLTFHGIPVAGGAAIEKESTE